MKIIIDTHNINRDFLISGFVENFSKYKMISDIVINEDGVITVELKDWFGKDIISLESLIKEMKTVLNYSFFSSKVV
ncbi:MAG: hypothetical protein ACRCX2_15605 [Paraclostridium sp.]